MEVLKQQRPPTTAVLLVDAVPARVEGAALVLRLPHPLLLDKFGRGEGHQERAAKAVLEVTGHPLRVRAEAAVVPPPRN
jgi:hypothetical protein